MDFERGADLALKSIQAGLCRGCWPWDADGFHIAAKQVLGRQLLFVAAGQLLVPFQSGPTLGGQFAQVIQLQVATIGQVTAAVKTNQPASGRYAVHQLSR